MRNIRDERLHAVLFRSQLLFLIARQLDVAENLLLEGRQGSIGIFHRARSPAQCPVHDGMKGVHLVGRLPLKGSYQRSPQHQQQKSKQDRSPTRPRFKPGKVSDRSNIPDDEKHECPCINRINPTPAGRFWGKVTIHSRSPAFQV
ncbi:hypothetical protein D1872_289670 [compost metagenome]